MGAAHGPFKVIKLAFIKQHAGHRRCCIYIYHCTLLLLVLVCMGDRTKYQQVVFDCLYQPYHFF